MCPILWRILLTDFNFARYPWKLHQGGFLEEFLQQHGITISPDFSGTIIREGSQWLIGRETPNGKFLMVGDWARDIEARWHERPGEFSPEIRALLEKERQENKAAREARQAEVAEAAQREWTEFFTLGHSPYLSRKGLYSLFGCRIEPSVHGARTIVPARDINGGLWGYQRIYSEKLDLGTDKIFRKGARKEGCFHSLVDLPQKETDSDPQTIYIAEGIATAASIFEATHGVVVSCFDAGNIYHVAKALREKFPQSYFIFCADNDQFPSKKDEKVYQTGLRKCEKALEAVGNGRIVLPSFKNLSTKPTDFNDLHQLEGLKTVTEQLTNTANTPVPTPEAPLTKPKKPSEKMIAEKLLSEYGENILCSNRNIFFYENGYWQLQSEDAKDYLRQKIGAIFGHKGSSRDIESALKYFLIHAPKVPPNKNLLAPPYFACNFTNGTLHVDWKPGEKPELRFAPHNRRDYLTTQLPYAFPGLGTLDQRNAEFDAMLERIFENDTDKTDKTRALAQLFGAVLVPCAPKIFFFVGPPGTGKSTVMKILHRLAAPENVSHVDPSNFEGFRMERMLGKLVNMVPDIELRRPINDSVTKMIVDRISVSIARKYQTDLQAPLPPIHVFGCNSMPKSYDGASGAYQRRFVVLEFNSFKAPKENLNFEETLWHAGFEGILNFAIKGLLDLLSQGGNFIALASSVAAIEEHAKESDPVAQYLDAVRTKEVEGFQQVIIETGARIERKNLWESFSKWQQDKVHPNAKVTLINFYRTLRNKGFTVKTVRGVRFFDGIGTLCQGEI